MNPFVKDCTAGLSVFLVAVPLCLGIAHASGAPLVSGLLSGIVGGVVIGFVSRSHLSVSGPAAGLTTIVLAGIATAGSFRAFLVATFLAGLIQIALGMLRAGTVNKLFPSPVIKGMLASIGLILISKQFSHMIGYDVEAFGAMAFQETGPSLMGEPSSHPLERNTLTVLLHALSFFETGAVIIGLLSFATLYGWDRFMLKRFPTVPGSLIAVALGTAINAFFLAAFPELALKSEHLVQIPDLSNGVFTTPDWSALSNGAIYGLALTLALVASIESLLSVEAIDRLDPQSRKTPPNRELLAQGVGNCLAGLIGGLPVTSVIVRSSVNLSAGATSKRSAIAHGVYLIAAMMLLRPVINLVPLATLAAILIQVGIKLAAPASIRFMLSRGAPQAVPYLTTILVVLFTDLLVGIGAGVLVSAFFILRSLYASQGFVVERHPRLLRIVFDEEVTFFHKARLATVLEKVEPFWQVEIDGSKARTIDYDVIDTLQTFRRRAVFNNIEFIIGGIDQMESYTPEQIAKIETEYNDILSKNRDWAAEQLQKDSEFFLKQAKGQTPSFLFIGCSDMNASADQITRAKPGALLVHRNIANLVSPHDVNLMSVLQYSVDILSVPHVVVCGHYDCTFVREAMTHHSMGLIDNWLSPVKHTANACKEELDAISDPEQRHRRLVELHALQQARNLLKISTVQRSIVKMGTPRIHAWVYDPETGVIKDLKTNVNLKEDIAEIYQYSESEDPT